MTGKSFGTACLYQCDGQLILTKVKCLGDRATLRRRTAEFAPDQCLD